MVAASRSVARRRRVRVSPSSMTLTVVRESGQQEVLPTEKGSGHRPHFGGHVRRHGREQRGLEVTWLTGHGWEHMAGSTSCTFTCYDLFFILDQPHSSHRSSPLYDFAPQSRSWFMLALFGHGSEQILCSLATMP